MAATAPMFVNRAFSLPPFVPNTRSETFGASRASQAACTSGVTLPAWKLMVRPSTAGMCVGAARRGLVAALLERELVGDRVDRGDARSRRRRGNHRGRRRRLRHHALG